MSITNSTLIALALLYSLSFAHLTTMTVIAFFKVLFITKKKAHGPPPVENKQNEALDPPPVDSEPKKRHMVESNNSPTVKLNVGGTIYEVSRSTLELYPNSMLARMVSKTWASAGASNDDEAKFICRDGQLFKYVLCWMRDGQVFLPVTESVLAFKKELDFYGLTNVEETSIVVEALHTRVTATVTANVHEELDAIDEDIKELKAMIDKFESHKRAIKTAHSLFVRSTAIDQGKVGKISIELTRREEKDDASYAMREARSFFEKCLSKYGLKFVSFGGDKYSWESQGCTFTLLRN